MVLPLAAGCQLLAMEPSTVPRNSEGGVIAMGAERFIDLCRPRALQEQPNTGGLKPCFIVSITV